MAGDGITTLRNRQSEKSASTQQFAHPDPLTGRDCDEAESVSCAWTDRCRFTGTWCG